MVPTREKPLKSESDERDMWKVEGGRSDSGTVSGLSCGLSSPSGIQEEKGLPRAPVLWYGTEHTGQGRQTDSQELEV